MVYDKNYHFLKNALSGHAICKGKNEYDWLIHKEVTSIVKYLKLGILDFLNFSYQKHDGQH